MFEINPLKTALIYVERGIFFLYCLYYEYFLIRLIIKELYKQFKLTIHIFHTELNAGNSLDCRDYMDRSTMLCF